MEIFLIGESPYLDLVDDAHGLHLRERHVGQRLEAAVLGVHVVRDLGEDGEASRVEAVLAQHKHCHDVGNSDDLVKSYY